MANNTMEAETTLSEAERKVVLLMRELGPYEKIEIKLVNDEISIVSTHTTKESYRR